MKRLLASISIIVLISTAFISGYFRFDRMEVYADEVPSGYSPAGASDQVDAFKAYCKYRNLAIEGSVLDAVTQVTTKTYNSLCNSLGLDINQLQNEIYKNSSAGQKFFFTVSGADAMNRIFAELLQNNNLAVGDEVNDKTIANGKFYDGSFVYVFQISYTPSVGTGVSNDKLISVGTPYISTDAFISLWNSNNSVSISNTNGTYTFPMYKVSNGYYSGNSNTYAEYTNTGNRYFRPGFPAYIYTTNGYLCFGAVFGNEGQVRINDWNGWMCRGIITGQNENIQDATVYITTNNTTINNKTIQGNTIINNNGTTEEPDPPAPTPTPDPGWGDPTDPNSGVWNTDDDGVLHFPKIELPDLDIDWSINGLGQKFPFSIPFDLIAFFTVLNAEPETPALQGQIDLGIINWDIDWDLSDFDDLAAILRNLEFIGFCIVLALATRNIIKG